MLRKKKDQEVRANDELRLAPEFAYQIVVFAGEELPIAPHEKYGKQKFGFNPDFTTFFKMDGKDSEGLLWVNHEYPDGLFLSGYDSKLGNKKTVEQITTEKLSVGGTVLHIQKNDAGAWTMVQNSPYTRRLTALFPDFQLTGPAAKDRPRVTGTLANCSGGHSPWETVLSCEENIQDFNPRSSTGSKYPYGWADVSSEKIDELDFGWVVEVDPYGKLPPRKHTALGRFAHENVSVVAFDGKPLVVYMGDDTKDGCLYRFVSAAPYRESMTQFEKSNLLTDEKLYAANIASLGWIPIAFLPEEGTKKQVDDNAEVNSKLRTAVNNAKIDNLFRKLQAEGIDRKTAKSEAIGAFQGKESDVTDIDLLYFAREAAWALGASQLHRPEDTEVIRDPVGEGYTVYVALTNLHSLVLWLAELMGYSPVQII